MRVFQQGSLIRVTASESDIDDFSSNWPGSVLGDLRRVSATFERSNGDLVDLYTNGRQGAGDFDGSELLALLQDMQAYAAKKLSKKR